MVDSVRYTQNDLRLIASLMSDMQVDGHRADLVVLKTARAHAAYEGRAQINDHDIALAIRLAIPHRLKRGPFADATAALDKLESSISDKRQEMGEEGDGEEEIQQGETTQENAQSKKKVIR